MLFGRARGLLSRRDKVRIAQRFKVGVAIKEGRVPKGRLKTVSDFQSSLPDLLLQCVHTQR